MDYQEKIEFIKSLTAEEIIKYLEKEFSSEEDVLDSLENDKINIEYIKQQDNYKLTPQQYMLDAAEFYYYWY